LTSHIGINSLSGKRKRTPSNNNSCEVRILLNSKRKKNQGKKNSNVYQADKIRDQNDDSSNVYQVDSAVAFANMATISSSIHSLSSKSSVTVS